MTADRSPISTTTRKTRAFSTFSHTQSTRLSVMASSCKRAPRDYAADSCTLCVDSDASRINEIANLTRDCPIASRQANNLMPNSRERANRHVRRAGCACVAVVQGVGFRPAVYRLAEREARVGGFVRNGLGGVWHRGRRGGDAPSPASPIRYGAKRRLSCARSSRSRSVEVRVPWGRRVPCPRERRGLANRDPHPGRRRLLRSLCPRALRASGPTLSLSLRQLHRLRAPASPSSAMFPTTARRPRWPRSSCAPRVVPNTKTLPTAASTPSPTLARRAGLAWRSWVGASDSPKETPRWSRRGSPRPRRHPRDQRPRGLPARGRRPQRRCGRSPSRSKGSPAQALCRDGARPR